MVAAIIRILRRTRLEYAGVNIQENQPKLRQSEYHIRCQWVVKAASLLVQSNVFFLTNEIEESEETSREDHSTLSDNVGQCLDQECFIFSKSNIFEYTCSYASTIVLIEKFCSTR